MINEPEFLLLDDSPPQVWILIPLHGFVIFSVSIEKREDIHSICESRYARGRTFVR